MDFFVLEERALSRLEGEYDVIWCSGSMHHAPFEIVHEEAQLLLQHLRPNGRWIELRYPMTRWQREGGMAFDKWGDKTDGGAPWAEWYDLEKLLARLSPARFDVVLYFTFHNENFVWFDLLRNPQLEREMTEPKRNLIIPSIPSSYLRTVLQPQNGPRSLLQLIC